MTGHADLRGEQTRRAMWPPWLLLTVAFLAGVAAMGAVIAALSAMLLWWGGHH